MTDERLHKQATAIVNALVGDKASDWWWNSPNRAFNGLTPDEYWVLDDKEVYSYLVGHLGGEYG